MTGETPISRRSFLSGRSLGDILPPVADPPTHAGDSHQPHTRAQTPINPSRSANESTRFRRSFPIHRPPGAIDEELFLEQCTRCDACIHACPHDAIIHAPPRFRRAAGTPMIDPMRQPCWMCEDTPCIAACEPRVLRDDMPLRMAVARVSPITCLAHQHSFCTVCSEQCPVPGAIEVTQGKPRIIEEVCTGCGVCQHVCPAPENAILLMPVADRPRHETPPTPDAKG